MKILLGLDNQPYSGFAVGQVARLAINTWADVTLLTSIKNTPRSAVSFQDLSAGNSFPSASFPSEADMLLEYWKLFLEQCPSDSPYSEETVDFRLVEIRDGVYEEMKIIRPRRKELKLRIRKGNAVDGMIAEAAEEGHDLIVIGCTGREGCAWKTPENLPERVVGKSTCSVLVTREEMKIQNICCCLDEETVTQDSLEILKQLATIYQASLTFVGLTQEGGIRHSVDRQLWSIADYYSSSGMDISVQLKEISQLETFLEGEAMPDLLAFWAGKSSLLSRFFPKNWLRDIVKKSSRSVLVLR